MPKMTRVNLRRFFIKGLKSTVAGFTSSIIIFFILLPLIGFSIDFLSLSIFAILLWVVNMILIGSILETYLGWNEKKEKR